MDSATTIPHRFADSGKLRRAADAKHHIVDPRQRVGQFGVGGLQHYVDRWIGVRPLEPQVVSYPPDRLGAASA